MARTKKKRTLQKVKSPHKIKVKLTLWQKIKKLLGIN